MTWILLKENLPIQDAPPKLSIVWAETDPDETAFDNLVQDWQDYVSNDKLYKELVYLPYAEVKEKLREYWSKKQLEGIGDNWGFVHNPLTRMKFYFNNTEMKVFGNEYNLMTAQKWNWFVYGEECSHVRFPLSYPESKMVELSDEGDLKTLYETALLEGATPEIARAITFMDINPMNTELEYFEPEPYGWYCLNPAYADYYGIDVSKYFSDYYKEEESES